MIWKLKLLTEEIETEEPQIQQKKKRGRPKGSKNKATLEKRPKTSEQ